MSTHMQGKPTIYKGTVIWPRNYCGMYSARVEVRDGGVPLAADTLAGMKQMITNTLAAHGQRKAG